MFDGEVMSLNTPLEFRIRPLALAVMVPQAANAPVAELPLAPTGTE